jgi:hypothetical protein
MKKLNLLISVATSTKVFIYKIMTPSTKSLTVANRIPKIGVFSPRLNVVHNSIVASGKNLITVLAGRIISSYAKVTPFNVQNVVTPLNIVSKVKLSVASLSIALLFISAFITIVRVNKSF